MSPRIAILETGRPPRALEASHGRYPEMFRALLGAGFSFETFDATTAVLPEPAAFDGAIITGSPAGVYEDHAWIPPLLDWIRVAKGQLRLVGICFGHQAMAQALGGRVEKSARGWGVGLHTYEVAVEAPWAQPAAASLSIPVSHQDQVVVAPPRARVIASSAFTPHAGLAFDDDAISFQCHPEFTADFAAALVEGRRDRIDAALVDQALSSLGGADDRAILGGWLRRFLAGADAVS